jgi:hypothetical protein
VCLGIDCQYAKARDKYDNPTAFHHIKVHFHRSRLCP